MMGGIYKQFNSKKTTAEMFDSASVYFSGKSVQLKVYGSGILETNILTGLGVETADSLL